MQAADLGQAQFHRSLLFLVGTELLLDRHQAIGFDSGPREQRSEDNDSNAILGSCVHHLWGDGRVAHQLDYRPIRRLA